MTARPCRSRSRGFSLVELMISLVLGILLIGGVSALFISNKQSYGTNQSLGEVQDNSRVAFELLARDVRQAGLTGCGNDDRVGNTLVNGVNNSGTTWWAQWGDSVGDKAVKGYDANVADPAVTTGAAVGQRIAATSSVELMGPGGSGYSLASQVQAGSNPTITLNEASSDLTAGDIIIVCDPDHATIMQVTAYSNPTLTHAQGGTSSPGNCTRGVGYPTNCDGGNGNSYNFGPNALISKLQVSDWYIGTNAQGGRSLYRSTLTNNAGTPGMTTQEMIRNVTDMQITYHVADDPPRTTYVNAASVAAADWQNVDAMYVTLTFASSDTRSTTANQRLSRTMSATITFRNRTS